MAIRRPTAGAQRALLAVAEADFKKRRMNLAAVFVSSADRLGTRWLTKLWFPWLPPLCYLAAKRSILVAVTLLACVVVAEAQQPGVDKVAK